MKYMHERALCTYFVIRGKEYKFLLCDLFIYFDSKGQYIRKSKCEFSCLQFKTTLDLFCGLSENGHF